MHEHQERDFAVIDADQFDGADVQTRISAANVERIARDRRQCVARPVFPWVGHQWWLRLLGLPLPGYGKP